MNLWRYQRFYVLGGMGAPTGLIVLLAVGWALLDVGDGLDEQTVGEAMPTIMGVSFDAATMVAVGLGLAVLLVGVGLAVWTYLDDGGEEDDALPVHCGGPPPPPATGGGIDIG